ncbi:MAG: hypothetical protein HY744_28040 [Deltaproteobacteria bacterium]|nr:hypothetical protein [Deltaproteobacteria bacterium]
MSVLVAALAAGCGGVAVWDGHEHGTGGGGEGGGSSRPAWPIERLDLLLLVDNSRAMGDKQQVLKETLPDLVGGLVNFEPIEDIHIGIVSSSIGGHGADACDPEKDPTQNFSVNDKAHLLSRKSVQSQEGIATFNNLGFLAWDPAGKYGGEKDANKLLDDLGQIVNGVGEVGCGYEAPLEAWYRFLVDPDPYAKITINEKAQAVLEGTDQVLLEQRKAFLRPDSLLVIIMLTDENDCSIKDGGQNYFAAQIYAPGPQSAPYHLPKPRAACAKDPNDPCCRSCGQAPGEGCDTSQDVCDGSLDPLDDGINLRCFDQKRRFGIDFLNPIDRYAAGLTSPVVPDRTGQTLPNPIFMDLDPGDDITNVRDAGLVLITGIVGVPWQDIARRNSQGQPDLLAGLNKKGKPVGGFQDAEELAENGTWDLILGDPANYVKPKDPLMWESIEPRQGTSPVTGEALAPPGAAKNANSINGHEHGWDCCALQYACVFDLGEPRDCTDPMMVACDCADPNNDNPLCQADDNSFGQIQYRAKAFPGLRELSLLKAVGAQAVVASICPRQAGDPEAADFGYRAAVAATLQRIEQLVARN